MLLLLSPHAYYALSAAQKEVEVWKRAREAGAEEERLVVDVTEKLEAPLVSTEREVRAPSNISTSAESLYSAHRNCAPLRCVN